MRICSCLVLLGVMALPALGHELTGPTFVFANSQGHFSYDLNLVVSSPTPLGSTQFDGSVNTDVQVWVDGFCQTTMVPGTSLLEVDGNLIDEGANGQVVATVHLCDPWVGVVTTTVLPYPVEDRVSTWGLVKSLYR
jgi:hypothetical protein